MPLCGKRPLSLNLSDFLLLHSTKINFEKRNRHKILKLVIRKENPSMMYLHDTPFVHSV